MSDRAKNAAIAVYCGSSVGKQKAYASAALSVGRALAAQNRPLIYGGGNSGLMGIVSNAVLEGGGWVTGIIPFAIHTAGGETDKTPSNQNPIVDVRDVDTDNKGPGKMQTIIVDSMHERKVEMASRSSGFIGLPGGLGTYEEVFEVTTWTQLGIHSKPVVLLNVLSFFDPLRHLFQNGIKEGYIHPSNQNLIVFVDGPASHEEHNNFDWGTAALEAVDAWHGDNIQPLFNWKRRKDGSTSASLSAI